MFGFLLTPVFNVMQKSKIFKTKLVRILIVQLGFNHLFTRIHLQDQGKVSICVWRHLLILWGVTPAGPLHVQTRLSTLYPGAVPRRSVYSGNHTQQATNTLELLVYFLVTQQAEHIFNSCLCSLVPQLYEEAESILSMPSKSVTVNSPPESWYCKACACCYPTHPSSPRPPHSFPPGLAETLWKMEAIRGNVETRSRWREETKKKGRRLTEHLKSRL